MTEQSACRDYDKDDGASGLPSRRKRAVLPQIKASGGAGSTRFRTYSSLNEFGEARESGGRMADRINLDRIDGTYNG